MNRYRLTNFIWRLSAALAAQSRVSLQLKMSWLRKRYPDTNRTTHLTFDSETQALTLRFHLLEALRAKGWVNDPDIGDCVRFTQGSKVLHLHISPVHSGLEFEVTPYVYKLS